MARSEPCHADAVFRFRLAILAGLVLVAVACCLPTFTFLELSGTSLPYQDPTPDMLQQQASEVADLERELAVRLVIGAGLGAFGVALAVVGVTRMQIGRAHV